MKFENKKKYLENFGTKSLSLNISTELGDSQEYLQDFIDSEFFIGVNKTLNTIYSNFESIKNNVTLYKVQYQTDKAKTILKIDRNMYTAKLFNIFELLDIYITNDLLIAKDMDTSKMNEIEVSDENITKLLSKEDGVNEGNKIQLIYYLHSLFEIFACTDMKTTSQTLSSIMNGDSSKREVTKYFNNLASRLNLKDIKEFEIKHNNTKLFEDIGYLKCTNYATTEEDSIIDISYLDYNEVIVEDNKDYEHIGIFKLPKHTNYGLFTISNMSGSSLKPVVKFHIDTSSLTVSEFKILTRLKLLNGKKETNIEIHNIHPEDSLKEFEVIDFMQSDVLKSIGNGKLEVDKEIKVPYLAFDKDLFSTLDDSEINPEYTDDISKSYYEKAKEVTKNINLDNSLKSIAKLFKNGEIYSMFFVGASGTGKTTQARNIAIYSGIPPISINMAVNVEESDLIGTMIPNPHKKASEDPEFIWKDGLITQAVRNGYIIILEEVNMARPGVLAKLNNLLDDIRQLDLPTGELVYAHKNFRCIATGNMAYEGTNRMNKAFLNRFNLVKVFDNFCNDELVKIIQKSVPYDNTNVIGQVLKVYMALEKYIKENRINAVVSIRQLMNVFIQRKAYKTTEENIINTLINPVLIENMEWRNDFIESILPSLDLSFKI